MLISSPNELALFVEKFLATLDLPKIKAGHLRGVEYYRGQLTTVLVHNLWHFAQVNGHFPEHPLECKGLREKLFWLKFFVSLPVPTPADKLSVAHFIPEEVKSLVKVPKVYWSSTSASGLPRSIDAQSGGYFLKTNHGNRGMCRIDMPISDEAYDVIKSEASAWLARRNYGYKVGEWWYSTIEPKLYVEEEIKDEDGVAKQFKFLCVNGKIFSIYRAVYNNLKASEETIFDSEFCWVPGVRGRSSPNPERPAPHDAHRLMRVAEAIAKPFQFARIDLYNPGPGILYLGEITFCPDSGFRAYSPSKFDEELGSSWDFTQNFS